MAAVAPQAGAFLGVAAGTMFVLSLVFGERVNVPWEAMLGAYLLVALGARWAELRADYRSDR